MNNNLTDITIVLDRSGSMNICKEDAEGGVNSLIEDQKKQDGECHLTLIEFDDQYNVVCDGIPVQDSVKYTLVPRGWTALYDAIGKAINTTGARLAALSEDERPGKVLFVIVTDGLENSSKEFTAKDIKAMIDEQTNTYKWEFTYIGANQDAFAVGGQLGIRKDTTLNYGVGQTRCVFASLSSNISSVRSGEASSLSYSADQRSSAVGDSSDV